MAHPLLSIARTRDETRGFLLLDSLLAIDTYIGDRIYEHYCYWCFGVIHFNIVAVAVAVAVAFVIVIVIVIVVQRERNFAKMLNSINFLDAIVGTLHRNKLAQLDSMDFAGTVNSCDLKKLSVQF